jgi:hypothetical protein
VIGHSLNHDAAVERCARLGALRTIDVKHVTSSLLLLQIA